MKLGLTVVWRDVRIGVGSGFEFSKWAEEDSYDLYHPLKIHVPKKTFTEPEVKGVGVGAPQNSDFSCVFIED